MKFVLRKQQEALGWAGENDEFSVKKLCITGVLALGCSTLIPRSASAAILVINEVYGGGGNSGATYTTDYVELFNSGSTSINIGGYAVQYAPASTGTFAGVTITANTMLAGGAYYLIGFDSGATGSALPITPNQTGSTNISATAGRIRLLDNAATPVVVDFVAYGSGATGFEGTGAAPAPSNTSSISRLPNGTDNDQNATDFKVTSGASQTPGSANVPEPASLAFVGVAICGLLRRRA